MCASLSIITLPKYKSSMTVSAHSLLTACSQALITILFPHSPIQLSIDVSKQGEKVTSNEPQHLNDYPKKSMNKHVVLKKIQKH